MDIEDVPRRGLDAAMDVGDMPRRGLDADTDSEPSTGDGPWGADTDSDSDLDAATGDPLYPRHSTWSRVDFESHPDDEGDDDSVLYLGVPAPKLKVPFILAGPAAGRLQGGPRPQELAAAAGPPAQRSSTPPRQRAEPQAPAASRMDATPQRPRRALKREDTGDRVPLPARLSRRAISYEGEEKGTQKTAEASVPGGAPPQPAPERPAAAPALTWSKYEPLAEEDRGYARTFPLIGEKAAYLDAQRRSASPGR